MSRVLVLAVQHTFQHVLGSKRTQADKDGSLRTCQIRQSTAGQLPCLAHRRQGEGHACLE